VVPLGHRSEVKGPSRTSGNSDSRAARWATALLSAPSQSHFEFRKDGETQVQGRTVWEVKFRETATPSLWSQPIPP
jgi:hypothetical protein